MSPDAYRSMRTVARTWHRRGRPDWLPGVMWRTGRLRDDQNMVDTGAPGADVAPAPAHPLRQRVRTYLGDLGHAVLTGPDRPPPFRWLRRSRRWHVPLLIGVAVLSLALPDEPGLWLTRRSVLYAVGEVLYHPIGAVLRVVVAMLIAALVLLALRRPLLAWRVTWLVAAYETAAGIWLLWRLNQPDPPTLDVASGGEPPPVLGFSPPLLVLLLTVGLFLVAASQDRGVVFWAWLLTVVLAVAASGAIATVQVVPPTGLPIPLAPGDAPLVEPPGQPPYFGHPLLVLATVTVPVSLGTVAGLAVQHQARTRRQLVEVKERELVLDERARIARELHDVVAHHVSLVAVRAETAPYRLTGLPDAAREEFAEISRISRESLAEMRRLLGVLRSEGPPPTAPQPGLADLAELLEWIRSTGTPVRLETHGSVAGLPAAVDVSAYRILQEALTNAARHATGAPVRVRLQRTASELTLSVRNDPPPGRAGGGHGAPPAGEAGHGLRGMRERAGMLGGELHAGPTADGGFEVTATLPLRGERA